MRFFARLAPAARAQHAVQPALPPRFAGPSANVPEIDAESPGAPVSATSPDAHEPERREPREAPRAPPHDTAPDRAPRAHRDAIDVSEPANAHDPARVSPALTPTLAPTVAVRSAVVPIPRAPHARDADAAPQALDGARPLARAQPVDVPAAPMPQHPLGALALAQRMHPAKSEPTVVHVPIDRIDVRAPAAPKAPRAAAKPRAAPSLSLADYLRGSKA
jgi:hypothetical protein